MKPGGRIVYVTCSVLPEENEEPSAAFLGAMPDFAPVAPGELAAAASRLERLPAISAPGGKGLQLSPRRTGTDGFYVAVLRRPMTRGPMR